MRLIDTIDVPGAARKRVELYQGDLTDLTPAEAFDTLVVSAFPDDYTATPRSLIGALARKGVSVESLAIDKDVDLRGAYACWLSREFKPANPALQFRRILCFEPQVRGRPPEVVGDIFRALVPILAERPDIRSIAAPVVAAGDQGYSTVEMLAPLLDAALHWLTRGLPLERFKIVAYAQEHADEAARVFAQRKSALAPKPPPDAAFDTTVSLQGSRSGDVVSRRSTDDSAAEMPSGATGRAGTDQPSALPASGPAAGVDQLAEFDVFISYARANAAESEALERALRALRPGIRIFVDRKEIDIGSAWQPEIFESLDHCRKVVAMLSPAYLGSKVCKEEFNIAWIRGRESDTDVIFPVYLYTTALPTYMKYRNYFDCREGDPGKLTEASRRLLAALDAAR